MARFSRRWGRGARETLKAAAWLPLLAAAALGGCSKIQPKPPAPPPSSAPAPGPDTAPPNSAGQPFARSRAYIQDASAAGPAWFVCDGLDSHSVRVVGLPTSAQKVGIVTFDKARPDKPAAGTLRLGPPDPGAGQIYYALTDDAGQDAGFLHAINPGVLGDPVGATTPPFTSMKLGGVETGCRWLQRTRVLGVSATQSLVVTQLADRALELRTFAFKDAATAAPSQGGDAERSTVPSMDIKGGEETAGGFIFKSGDVTYTVSASAAGATLSTIPASGQVTNEPLIAWELAPAP